MLRWLCRFQGHVRYRYPYLRQRCQDLGVAHSLVTSMGHRVLTSKKGSLDVSRSGTDHPRRGRRTKRMSGPRSSRRAPTKTTVSGRARETSARAAWSTIAS
ncbi:hypothetical protein MRX96_009503 [Rhipicephalus microplus]